MNLLCKYFTEVSSLFNIDPNRYARRELGTRELQGSKEGQSQ